MNMNDIASNSVHAFQYPRTGKRGVPQQFPRRLYEMLESESKLASTLPDHSQVISWSASGKAFGILDVNQFTSRVLSKYFRTSKFSSFQRNLNLYGFSKVRRGPDADMYAHPSFLRGRPEMLMQLRKCNTVAVRRGVSNKSTSESLSGKSSSTARAPAARSVSPSPPRIESAALNQNDHAGNQSISNLVRGSNDGARIVNPSLGYSTYPAIGTYKPAAQIPNMHSVAPSGVNRLALLATVLAATHV
mmetsp:Transcript_20448/g.26821  ORF Transcript_20448/g.26821 Transcript_20448/m.26821 type:complete len:246 (+) Transcript_20448:19-756(+)|eukprot:CAMPEP_0195301428 /NCGR_PEP_ID=MMETSP0707-20130614/29283_1 /TAXON_ID=33640 /ORGANISM="Asterionellopsis glacialis, Strain CCMP134" /LENGTH=245 /DNA_ID=CAMNT_0040364367 /DNA_START=155 /DNA_END=892 /DNA_ORIENTATION=-